MRCALVLVCLAACTRPPGAKAPEVEAPPAALATLAPQLAIGEEMAWDVYWQGMQVGKAELVVGARETRASFRTGILASAITSVSYQMATVLERGRPRSASEQLSRGGRAERIDAELGMASFTLQGQVPRRTPDGNPLHTLSSALGIVRAWSQSPVPQGYLWLVHRGELFRIDVFPPVKDEALGRKALRIDAVVRSLDQSTRLDVTIWLARNRDRTPLRFVVEDGGDRVSAELVESTTSFD